MKETQAQAAIRLSAALNRDVTRKCVRVWTANGWDLNDPPGIEAKLKMQERAPKRLAGGEPRDLSPIDPTASLADSIDRIKELLLAATDYETARTYKVQLEGLKHAFAIHKEQGHYVTRASQEQAGLRAGQAIKQLILKIPAELPQALLGLDYSDALQKCEDYAHAMLTEISSAETYES
jgi:hypothetical protein